MRVCCMLIVVLHAAALTVPLVRPALPPTKPAPNAYNRPYFRSGSAASRNPHKNSLLHSSEPIAYVIKTLFKFLPEVERARLCKLARAGNIHFFKTIGVLYGSKTGIEKLSMNESIRQSCIDLTEADSKYEKTKQLTNDLHVKVAEFLMLLQKQRSTDSPETIVKQWCLDTFYNKEL